MKKNKDNDKIKKSVQTSSACGPIWPKFELVRDVMDVHDVVCVTCKKMKKIRSKMKALEWSQEDVNRQIDRLTDRLTDGRRLDGYTVSSPYEPSAQVI